MKFGKYIQAKQVPGWSAYYLDYKFLKKIISSLAAKRPASEAAALASGIRPIDILSESSTVPSNTLETYSLIDASDKVLRRPPIFLGSERDLDQNPDIRAHKAAFFFKLERELEKINAFYLQKEAELKLRMETLLSKRRAAVMRSFPDYGRSITQKSVEWNAVEEGFRLLERDLGKLQQFVEINATGFRKILKKFDKRSTSTTKELYLSRQVEVQPVFNRQLISELSDTVAICLLDLTDLSSGLKFEKKFSANDILAQQIIAQQAFPSGPFRDLEYNLRRAVTNNDQSTITQYIRYCQTLGENEGGKATVTRILWNIVVDSLPEVSDLILSSLHSPFDFQFIDDINGRNCLQVAAIAGSQRLVELCILNGNTINHVDLYGRTALHYSCMKGHHLVSKQLLAANAAPDTLDRDNYTPLTYATMKGNVDCVRVLLCEGEVPVEPSTPVGDLTPLSLASQSGHIDIVLLLLEHNAHCLPNTAGEFPMHHAAREGHDEICRLLKNRDGWDVPDKYDEWTPLFHASRYGRDACVGILLEAGARFDYTDELGHLAIHYAAWYGHQRCLDLLLTAATCRPFFRPFPHTSKPMGSKSCPCESDFDQIPSLSLPPPIMPHRVYGHNYLDKSHLVQLTFCKSYSERSSGVRIHHRLISPVLEDGYSRASTPLKLVMTTSSNMDSSPYSFSLPILCERNVFTFQIGTLDELSLEFSIYPSFGTKTIARAVALPSLFTGVDNNCAFTLPFLDTRLNTVGEVEFEVQVVTAFENVTLEVGGEFATYWKSIDVPPPSLPQLGVTSSPHRSKLIGSAQASPSASSTEKGDAQLLTISSLEGSYLYVVIQVTRDSHPVVYTDWSIPELNFDLTVSDITLEQFEFLSRRLNRDVDCLSGRCGSGLSTVLKGMMISFVRFLELLPSSVNLSLELAFPSRTTRRRKSMSNRLSPNKFVDSVLQNIYQASSSLSDRYSRHQIMFVSFSPEMCMLLNWKQPNFPVFFASRCGNNNAFSPSPTAFGTEEENDERSLSIGAAVEFARSNNLLGVFADAALLIQVPSLIGGIRNAGLLVGALGELQSLDRLVKNSSISGTPVDASLSEGMVVFKGKLTN